MRNYLVFAVAGVPIVLTSCVALRGAPISAFGDDATVQAAQPRTTPRLTVAAYLGSTASNTARDLETAMKSAGYTQDFGGCDPLFGCVPTRTSPESYSHANPSLFAVRYAVTEHYGFELLFGGSATGMTSGRSTTEIVDLGYGGKVLALMVSAGSSAATVSAGPALLMAHWNYLSPDGNPERVRTTSVGWVVGAAARKSIVSRFYVEGTAQYRGFTSPTVRPSQPGRPSGSARVSHSYLGLGLGVTLPEK